MGEERTKLFQMRSRISWIKLLKEEDLSMKLTRSEGVLRMKRWNCNLLLKKQRQHWNKRRTKFSGAKWSSLKLRLRLIARLQLYKMPLRKAVLCWKLQIARDVQPNKNLLTPMRHLQTLEMSTNQLLLQRGNWNQNSTSLGLIWMR